MTDDQTALLHKAAESLRAAKVLRSEKPYDFAVSRAYYSMYYVAEAFLLGKGLSFSKHSKVLAAFGSHFTKDGTIPVQFHRYLIDGEANRNVGDYDIGPGLSVEEANEQIRHAEEFVDLASRIIGSMPPDPS